MDLLTRLLIERQSSFLRHEDIDITLLTWNINGIAPPNVDVMSYNLLPDRPGELIAVGLQELAPANSNYYYYGGQEAACRENFGRWSATLQFAINYKYASSHHNTVHSGYRLAGEARMAGIGLLLFVKEKADVKVIAKGAVPCGVMGVWTNKGAVAVKLRVFETVIVIVCAHLAAHVQYWTRRNQDYLDIRSKMLLDGSMSAGVDEEAKSNEERVREAVKRWLCTTGNTIDDCEHVLWMGDLNYRFNDGDRNRIIKLADLLDYEQLMRTDQLRLSMFMQTAFHDFSEPQICFPPTFKYLKGEARFDEQRVPAYCDRILWRRGADDAAIKSLLYDSPAVYLSDHRPVVSVLAVRVDKMDNTLFSAAYQDAMSHMDTMENDLIPSTRLQVLNGNQEEGVLAVGRCWFNRAYTGQVELSIEGTTTAAEFVVLIDERVSWIRVSPVSGILLPNAVAILNFTVQVDCIAAKLLNEEPEKFNTVVVVHIVNGKDHFVSVEGDYQTSQFGRVTKGIPLALQKLGDFIIEHDGIKTPNMLMQAGAPGLVDSLIEIIDSGSEIPATFAEGENMLAVGECLLLYLQSAPLSYSQDLQVVNYITSLFKEMPNINDTVDADALRVVLGGALCKERVFEKEANVERLLQFMREYL